MTTTCRACGKKESGVEYFCRSCWFKLPAKERQSFHSMYKNKQDVSSKLTKLIALLK